MPTKILIVDAVKMRRQVVLDFLEISHPEIESSKLIIDKPIFWPQSNP